jgi:methylated-DNA-[protein]-cysteine S-methyltransferase
MFSVVQVVRYEADGWGIGELVHDGSRLLYLDHPRPRPETAPKAPQGMPEIPVIRLSTNSAPVGDDFVSRLAALLGGYFAGEPIDFSGVPVDLDWCTPFQLALVTAARSVPRGETVTYGELAALAGRPNAARAAGTFCAQNRFGLVVPCHRVVAAAGLGSYGSLGLQYKRRLLELEGANVAV